MENYHLNSGNNKGSPIMKFLNRKRRFKEERHVNFFADIGDQTFAFGGKCKGSMKKGVISVEVGIRKNDSEVTNERHAYSQLGNLHIIIMLRFSY